MVLKFLTLLLPWRLRRWVLNTAFGYKLHPKSRIGLALGLSQAISHGCT